MSMPANFADFFYGECVTEVCEAERKWRGKSCQLIGQQQTNPSNRSSKVQILRDICTRFGRYLYILYEVQLDNGNYYSFSWI